MGKLQDAILDILSSRQQMTQSELQWRVAHQRSGGSSGDLSASSYNATSRALVQMKKEGLVLERSRKPRLFDDIVRTYPWQTKSLEIKEMRDRLLPHLREIVEKSIARFDEADIEEKLLRVIAQERPDAVKLATATWAAEVRPALRRAVGVSDQSEECARHALGLLVRGVQLFEQSIMDFEWFSTSVSFTILSGRIPVGASPELGAAVHASDSLVRQVFPSHEVDYYRLKGRLYSVVDFTTASGLGRINDHALSDLHRRERGYVESLPDHRDAVTRTGPWETSEPVRFSPQLSRLLQKDCLRAVSMLSRPSRDGQARRAA